MDEKRATVSQMSGFIKQKRNREFADTFLGNSFAKKLESQAGIFMSVSAMFNNVNVISFLFGLGYSINYRDAKGRTPLIKAAYSNSFNAVQLLLTLGADILAIDNDGLNVFRILIKKILPIPILATLWGRLKNSQLGPHQIADELMRANCDLNCIFHVFNDPQITREIFTRYRVNVSNVELFAMLKRAVYSKNIEFVKLLLQYPPDLNTRRHWFIQEVTQNIFGPVTRPFFQQLVNWNLIDQPHVKVVKQYLKNGNKEIVEAFLDIGIDNYCRVKFGWSLLPDIFQNINIDKIQLLKNRLKQFDINIQNENKDTVLHLAVLGNDRNLVQYLLENSADPNIKNRDGRTPLFLRPRTDKNNEIADLLIEAGADLQVVDKYDICVMQTWNYGDYVKAKIFILQAQGLLNKKTREILYDNSDEENSNEDLKIMPENLDWMKNRWVSKSITLFTVLTEKFESLARYVKDDKVFADILYATSYERELKSIFVTMLMKNLKKARGFNELKVKAAKFICMKMRIVDCNHLVISKIIGYLKYKDLLVFNEMKEV